MTLDKEDIRAIAEQVAALVAKMVGQRTEPDGVAVHQMRSEARRDLQEAMARKQRGRA